MLSFSEFKRKQQEEMTLDTIFANLADEVAYLHIDPNRLNEVVKICVEWADSFTDSFKTLREHSLLSEISTLVNEEAINCATESRRIIQKYQHVLKETAVNPIDNAELHIDRILNALKDELIMQFGVRPLMSPQPQQAPQAQEKPLTWWDRLKRWAKGMWYGPGDPRMRQAAKSSGQQPNDYYSKYEGVEPEYIEILFEDVIKESVSTLIQILNKYKDQLLSVVKQAIHYHDILKGKYGSYSDPSTPTDTSDVPDMFSSKRSKPDDEDHDWDIQADDREPEVPPIGKAKMDDFPVKDSVPHSEKHPRPDPKTPEEPKMPPIEEPKAAEEEPAAPKDVSSIKPDEPTPPPTSEPEVPTEVPSEPKPRKKRVKKEKPPEEIKAPKEPAPEESPEQKLEKVKNLDASGKIPLITKKDLNEKFKSDNGKILYVKNKKETPVSDEVVEYNRYLYIRIGKDQWISVSKKDWHDFVGGQDKKEVEDIGDIPEKTAKDFSFLADDDDDAGPVFKRDDDDDDLHQGKDKKDDGFLF